MATSVEKTFVFTFTTKGKKSILKAPVQIPLNISAREFAGRLIKAHNLPCFVEDGKSVFIQQYLLTRQIDSTHTNNKP